MMAKNMFLAACNFWPKLPGLNAHALPSLARWINAKLTNDHDAVLIRELLKKKKSDQKSPDSCLSNFSQRNRGKDMVSSPPTTLCRERETSSGWCKAEEQQNEYHKQHISIRDRIMFEGSAFHIVLHLWTLWTMCCFRFYLEGQWWCFESSKQAIVRGVGSNHRITKKQSIQKIEQIN